MRLPAWTWFLKGGAHALRCTRYPGRRPHHVQGGDGVILTSRGGDVEVVGQAPTTSDAIDLIERHKPDVVITQVEHHLKRAEEILAAMRSASPHSRIVVLTMFDNLHYVRALSRLGIDAYVHKSSSVEELLATVSALSREPGRGQRGDIHAPRLPPTYRGRPRRHSLRQGA